MSMSLGNVYIWTYTYRLMRNSGVLYHKMREESNLAAICNAESEVNGEAQIIKTESNGNCNGHEAMDQPPVELTTESPVVGKEIGTEDKNVSGEDHVITIGKDSKSDQEVAEVEKTTEQLFSSKKKNFRARFQGLNKMLEELFAPPTIAAIIGLFVGAIPWLKKLIIGVSAPLRVIEDTISTLGNALLPCTILILGGNLTQGIRKSTLKPIVVVVIMLVRYVLLPIAGIGVVKAAGHLGLLPHDPLFHYVLMIQFALPPAMSIGTMAQLFDVAKEECSVIFLWTYLAAMLALTIWPTIFMSILS